MVVNIEDLTPAQRRLVEALIDALREETKSEKSAELLSIAESARRLGIGRSRLYAEIQAGTIRSVKIGRRRLISSSEIERMAWPARDGRG